MAVVNGYCTAANLRERFGLDTSDNDALLINAINAASRMIDGHCHRRFYVDSTVSARTFYASDCDHVKVDDFSTTTGLIVKTDSADNGTFDQTWTIATDFQVEPLNGVSDGIEGHAYTRIRRVGTRMFRAGRRPRVQVTAKWGWASVPDQVEDACMIQAARLFRRKDTPDGISSGFEGFGVVRVNTRMDPDVEMLLAPFRKPVA